MHGGDIASALVKMGVILCLAAILPVVLMIGLSLYRRFSGQSVVYLEEAVGVSFVFGLLAIVAGTLMSAARLVAVAEILPAALTFIGGVCLYLVGTQKAKTLVIGCAVASFSAMFFLGATLGYYERYRSNYRLMLDTYDLEALKWKADVEYRIETYRRSLNLPPAFGKPVEVSADDTEAPPP